MLPEARPTPADKALLVDGGSGYLAELLRPLVGSLEVADARPRPSAEARKGGDFTLLRDRRRDRAAARRAGRAAWPTAAAS